MQNSIKFCISNTLTSFNIIHNNERILHNKKSIKT